MWRWDEPRCSSLPCFVSCLYALASMRHRKYTNNTRSHSTAWRSESTSIDALGRTAASGQRTGGRTRRPTGHFDYLCRREKKGFHDVRRGRGKRFAQQFSRNISTSPDHLKHRAMIRRERGSERENKIEREIERQSIQKCGAIRYTGHRQTTDVTYLQ